jgi:nucleoside 2-deoxyribosyltransferase
MLSIAGGTYWEYCTEGDWSQLFGSGLRAAAALKSVPENIKLFTYVNRKQDLPTLEAVGSATFGVMISPFERKCPISFSYQHGLSTPVLRPALHELAPEAAISIQADAILRFGFVEGQATVNGGRVVYDPQSPNAPERFDANGSTAEKLAIVCNGREALRLTQELEVTKAIKVLHDDHRADVVVVKCGADGALVSDKKQVTSVSALETERVWPIGSGDVFAAWFAYSWGIQRLGAVEAASHASRAAAFYCETKTLPVPRPDELIKDFQRRAVPSTASSDSSQKPKVYLAGPFFTMMQRWLIEESRTALRNMGFEVFSPFHDVGFGTAKEVAPADLCAIDSSNIVFAILEGLDSGTLFEIGYARAKSIPVVGFAQAVVEESLKMLSGTDCVICDDFVTAIYRTVWKLRA